MSATSDIIVTRDGIWPGVWRWETEVRIVVFHGESQTTRMKHMSGDAITKNRAFKKARKAQDTYEVGR